MTATIVQGLRIIVFTIMRLGPIAVDDTMMPVSTAVDNPETIAGGNTEHRVSMTGSIIFGGQPLDASVQPCLEDLTKKKVDVSLIQLEVTKTKAASVMEWMNTLENK